MILVYSMLLISSRCQICLLLKIFQEIFIVITNCLNIRISGLNHSEKCSKRPRERMKDIERLNKTIHHKRDLQSNAKNLPKEFSSVPLHIHSMCLKQLKTPLQVVFYVWRIFHGLGDKLDQLIEMLLSYRSYNGRY